MWWQVSGTGAVREVVWRRVRCAGGSGGARVRGKKIAAGICGILLGQFGIHKFILGLHTPAVIMLVTTCFSYILGSCLVVPYLGVGVMAVIGVVEGVLYLLKSDEEFYETYAVRRKEWF